MIKYCYALFIFSFFIFNVNQLYSSTKNINSTIKQSIGLSKGGKIKKAISLCKDVLAKFDAEEKKSLETVPLLVHLGRLYKKNKEFSKAENALQTAMQMRQKINGKDPYLAKIYLLLAKTYDAKGDLKNADEYFSKSLLVFKTNFPDKKNKLASLFIMMAKFYGRNNILQKAADNYEKALNYKAEAGKSETYDAGLAMYELAEIYLKLKELSKASMYYLEALNVFKTSKSQKEQSFIYDGLAYIQQAENNLDKAKIFYTYALNIRKTEYGDKNMAVANSLNNLAMVLLSQKKYTEALPLFKDALAICKVHFKGKNPIKDDIIKRIAECEAKSK